MTVTGRHPALGDRYDGDQRNRFGTGRKLAIDQINAMGGVILGRKIEYIQEDGASDWLTFAEKPKLLVNDKVASVFGCWTSASRKAVLPVFEQYNGLYHPTFYEGLEQSPT